MAENMPKKPPPPPAYLSEVPSRSYAAGGTYKHHLTLGYAKAAIAATGSGRYGYRGGKIYKWDAEANEWELLFDIPNGMKDTELPWNVEKAKKEAERKLEADRKQAQDQAKRAMAELEGL